MESTKACQIVEVEPSFDSEQKLPIRLSVAPAKTKMFLRRIPPPSSDSLLQVFDPQHIIQGNVEDLLIPDLILALQQPATECKWDDDGDRT